MRVIEVQGQASATSEALGPGDLETCVRCLLGVSLGSEIVSWSCDDRGSGSI